MPYRRIAVLTAPASSLAFLALGLLSCDNADPVSPAEAQQPTVQAAGPAAEGDSLTLLGPDGVAYSLAPGDFPFSTTVSSWQDAFSIKQAGTGRSGQFIVGNPSNTKEALMASHNGSGTALYAIARGTGRAGYYRIDNASNGNGALIGETNGTGAGILAYTTGSGPAANFVVNNAGNSSAALRAETSGTGNLLELVAGGSDIGQIDRDGGFVLVNGPSAGSIPVDGPGVRMMWYPAKAAFRAGNVTGTQWDDANIGSNSVAMGFNVKASGSNSVAMGLSTEASGLYSTAFGSTSKATGNIGFASGYGTEASGLHSTAMGSSTTASGARSTAMGYQTTADGTRSTALGSYVAANGKTGVFLTGDASTTTPMMPAVDNYFMARFDAGYFLATSAALDAGVFLTGGGGSWNTISDEARKENFRELDGESVLEEIAAMGIREWNYRSQDASIRHVGPTAQDFYAAFGLGTSDKAIATVDADGIALAGVKALERRTRELQAGLAAEREARQELERENRALRGRLDRLEAALLDR